MPKIALNDLLNIKPEDYANTRIKLISIMESMTLWTCICKIPTL